VDRTVRANFGVGNLTVTGSSKNLDALGGSGCAGGVEQRERVKTRRNFDQGFIGAKYQVEQRHASAVRV